MIAALADGFTGPLSVKVEEKRQVPPIVAPVGPPVKFLQHFRDRQKAQAQRGFCASSLGFGNQRTAESLSERVAQFTLQAIYHRVFNHVTERRLAKVEVSFPWACSAGAMSNRSRRSQAW